MSDFYSNIELLDQMNDIDRAVVQYAVDDVLQNLPPMSDSDIYKIERAIIDGVMNSNRAQAAA